MREQGGRHLPYALLLPGIQLLVAALVITPDLKLGMELEHRSHSVTLDGKLVPGQLDINELMNIAIHLPKRTYPDRLHAMSILNMPGIFGEIVTSLPTTWPDSWFPRSVYFPDLWTWRALSWAIYTLPFWWMAGRAFDALGLRKGIALPRVRWVEMLIMMATGVFTVLLWAGSFFTGMAETTMGLRDGC